MVSHFIYCGDHYFEDAEELEEIILEKMRKYEIQSSILTMLKMARWKLVTQEKVKKAAEGKLKMMKIGKIMKDPLMMIWRSS